MQTTVSNSMRATSRSATVHAWRHACTCLCRRASSSKQSSNALCSRSSKNRPSCATRKTLAARRPTSSSTTTHTAVTAASTSPTVVDGHRIGHRHACLQPDNTLNFDADQDVCPAQACCEQEARPIPLQTCVQDAEAGQMQPATDHGGQDAVVIQQAVRPIRRSSGVHRRLGTHAAP